MKTVAVAGVSSTTSGSPPNIKNTNNIHSIGSDNSSNSVTLTSDNNNTESNYFDDKSLDSSTAAGVDIQFQTPTSTQNSTKRPISLDLNINKNPVKKQRLVTSTAGGGSATTAAQSAVPSTLVLESPDLQGIKMTTPDLEKFLLSGSLLQTPTPGIVFPTKVTSEQEDYAKGFVDALNSLRNSENSHSNGMSGGSFTYTNLETSFPVAIKDEPQGGPASPPVSPIDMETQEKIKLERKRQRNRVAASKCRKRKLERISKLEDKVKLLKGENSDLASVVKNLKEHVFQLKQQVIEHIGSGCNISAQNCGTVLQGK